MVGPTNIVGQLRRKLGENAIRPQQTADGIPTCWIARQNAHDALRYLKEEVGEPYRMLFDLTAIDERMRVHREGQPASDFTMVYHLLSFDRNEYLRIKVPLKRGQPPIDTATDLWPAANWYEREVWDMFGIRFQGHPHMERILMPRTWEGHSLLKDDPGRATEMVSFPPPDEKEDTEQRFQPEKWGMRAGRGGMDFMFLNFGPQQQPGTRGVLRVALQLDGEQIVDAVPQIGFYHRGAEKMGERQSWHTYVPYTDRIGYLGGVMNNMAYLMAVEKLAGIEVPLRTKVIRVMLAELFRIVSHLAWYGTFSQDLGQLSPVFHTFNDRERAFAIIEAVCGTRIHPNWFRAGGIAEDLPKDWDAQVREFLKYLPPRLIEYDKEVMQNRIFKARTQGVGVFTTEEAIEWGVTGPNLRACGLAWDFRKKQPYSGYEQFEFDIPSGRHGDCYDRGAVRVEEMRQSLRIVEQCVNNMPESTHESAQPLACPPPKERTMHDIETPIMHVVGVSRGPVIPPGEALGAIEATEGNIGYYLVSDGGTSSYRTRIRTPSFAHMQMMPRLARGRMIPDLFAILGAMDFVLGDVDR
jgi:NADH-quinone oxidoreductase subunit C/D